MWRSPGHVYGATTAHSAQLRLVPSTGSGTGLDSKRRECDEKVEDLEKPGSWWSEREPWAPVKCEGGGQSCRCGLSFWYQGLSRVSACLGSYGAGEIME